MQEINPEAAVEEAARILGLDLSEDERKILSYMSLAGTAFWQPSQIAPGVRLSVLRIRSRLRGLEDAGYVERSRVAEGSETEFRLTNKGERALS
jgi:DNA-binding MarR family transcriptional regulator